MEASDFQQPEQFVAAVKACLDERRFDEAIRLAGLVDDVFPRNPLAQHAAGLAYEQTFLEERATGSVPSLDYYARAEHHYRQALGHAAPELADEHAERLYSCLFVLGSQLGDKDRLEEARRMASAFAQNAPGEALRNRYKRELAVVWTGIARITQDLADWERAEAEWEQAPEGTTDQDVFFGNYYRGLAKRAIGQADGNQDLLSKAAACFREALDLDYSRGLEYLLADCLLQLHDPSFAEVLEMKELVPRLVESNPGDRLLQSLGRRWEKRREILERDGLLPPSQSGE